MVAATNRSGSITAIGHEILLTSQSRPNCLKCFPSIAGALIAHYFPVHKKTRLIAGKCVAGLTLNG